MKLIFIHVVTSGTSWQSVYKGVDPWGFSL